VIRTISTNIFKEIAVLATVFLICSCTESNFREELIRSLSSGDYRFIIDNSVSIIAESAQRSYLQGEKAFDEDISFIKCDKYFGVNLYTMYLKEKNGRIIVVQYEKRNKKFFILSIDFPHLKREEIEKHKFSLKKFMRTSP
jgi:hypothetical protein